ncbi:uncharacterized protein LOC123499955 [Portunus trituberculatus]|uniref:uncharacterized protein LOC123499955 n=1 Tax=Portunus trituberculatus TaxID=210409 RepID=UPI001E1CD358|nr:uncharacterized protein LOC123499955 [Portunus trituberculatus]
MSPTLFIIYLEELITRIRVSGRGVDIGGSRLGCLAYADDVVLTADRKEVMEELLKITAQFGKECQLRFSARKCKVIEINDNQDNQWVMRNYIPEVVEKYTYIGLEISNEGIRRERQKKINEGKERRAAGMIFNGENRVINKYEVGKSL